MDFLCSFRLDHGESPLGTSPPSAAAGWEEKVAESSEQQEAIQATCGTKGPSQSSHCFQQKIWPCRVNSQQARPHLYQSTMGSKITSPPWGLGGLDDAGSAATAFLHHSGLFKSSADDGHFPGLYGYGFGVCHLDLFDYYFILFLHSILSLPFTRERRQNSDSGCTDSGHTSGVSLVQAIVPSP